MPSVLHAVNYVSNCKPMGYLPWVWVWVGYGYKNADPWKNPYPWCGYGFLWVWVWVLPNTHGLPMQNTTQAQQFVSQRHLTHPTCQMECVMIHGHTCLWGSSEARQFWPGSLSVQDSSPFRLLGWQYLINTSESREDQCICGYSGQQCIGLQP